MPIGDPVFATIVGSGGVFDRFSTHNAPIVVMPFKSARILGISGCIASTVIAYRGSIGLR